MARLTVEKIQRMKDDIDAGDWPRAEDVAQAIDDLHTIRMSVETIPDIFPDIFPDRVDLNDIYLMCEAILACSSSDSLRPLSSDDITTMAERIRNDLLCKTPLYASNTPVRYRSREDVLKQGTIRGKPYAALQTWEYRITNDYVTAFGTQVHEEERVRENEIIDRL